MIVSARLCDCPFVSTCGIINLEVDMKLSERIRDSMNASAYWEDVAKLEAKLLDLKVREEAYYNK